MADLRESLRELAFESSIGRFVVDRVNSQVVLSDDAFLAVVGVLIALTVFESFCTFIMCIAKMLGNGNQSLFADVSPS